MVLPQCRYTLFFWSLLPAPTYYIPQLVLESYILGYRSLGLGLFDRPQSTGCKVYKHLAVYNHIPIQFPFKFTSSRPGGFLFLSPWHISFTPLLLNLIGDATARICICRSCCFTHAALSLVRHLTRYSFHFCKLTVAMISFFLMKGS